MSAIAHTRRKRDNEYKPGEVVHIRHDDLPRGHGPVKPGSVLAAVIVFSCFAFLVGYAVKGIWP